MSSPQVGNKSICQNSLGRYSAGRVEGRKYLRERPPRALVVYAPQQSQKNSLSSYRAIQIQRFLSAFDSAARVFPRTVLYHESISDHSAWLYWFERSGCLWSRQKPSSRTPGVKGRAPATGRPLGSNSWLKFKRLFLKQQAQ